MKKTDKNPDRRKNNNIRRLKVTAVYGEIPLVECMKNVIKEKITLK